VVEVADMRLLPSPGFDMTKRSFRRSDDITDGIWGGAATPPYRFCVQRTQRHQRHQRTQRQQRFKALEEWIIGYAD